MISVLTFYLIGVAISGAISLQTHKKLLDSISGHVSFIANALTSWIGVIALILDIIIYLNNKHHENH